MNYSSYHPCVVTSWALPSPECYCWSTYMSHMHIDACWHAALTHQCLACAPRTTWFSFRMPTHLQLTQRQESSRQADWFEMRLTLHPMRRNLFFGVHRSHPLSTQLSFPIVFGSSCLDALASHGNANDPRHNEPQCNSWAALMVRGNWWSVATSFHDWADRKKQKLWWHTSLST